MQLDLALLAGEPHLGEPRHLARRADEAGVAAPAAAAAREANPRVRMGQVGDQIVPVEHLRADRDADLDVLAVRAVLAGAAAVASLRRGDQLAALERDEVAQIPVGDRDHVAAVAAVAAVGAALRDVLLPPERERAVAAAAGLHLELRAVGEHGLTAATAAATPRR